jgi:hypothetical protein
VFSFLIWFQVYLKFYQTKEKVLYQGNLIQPSLSFENFGIVDRERMLIFLEDLVSMLEDLKCSKFSLKKRREYFEHEHKPLTRKEFSGLINLFLIKMEYNEKFYHDVISNFQTLENESIIQQHYIYLIWKEYEDPNDKILPMLL